MKRLLRAFRPRRVPYVPQMETADCGAACLAMVLGYHGKQVGLDEVREVTGTGRDGVHALGLVEAAQWYGLNARGVRADVDELHRLSTASILHWEFRHFVVFERLRRNAVEVVDPAAGRRRIPLPQFRRCYTGIAIILEPGEGFRAASRRPKGTWRYLRPILGQARRVQRILVTSLLIRLFALAVPVLTGAVVDRIVPSGNKQLLLLVTMAMLAMAGYHFLASVLRGHLLLHLRTHLDLQLTVGFVGHLADLPYAFFLKRSAGDLMMRLRSHTTVRELLTTGALSSLLDGSMVCLYLILLLILSWPIGLLVAGLGALQALVLALSSKRNRLLMSESLEIEAQSQSYVYQLLAGIEALKAAGAEHRAVEHWSNLYVNELNVSLARGRLNVLVDSMISGLRLVAPLLILAFGAAQVLADKLTLGTMLALNALAGGFLEPLAMLVTTGLQLQLLGSYMERINDVLDTPREQHGQAARPAGRLSGHIRAESLSFRYRPLAPFVVNDVSLEICPGQKVAIVGRSGSGKSTLAQLLLGLYVPDGGKVYYDGTALTSLEVRSVRRQIGIVTQKAHVFGASIRENIALTAPTVPLEAIEQAARLACIHDDIAALPMGYETVLIDGGASLSGGQRQCIALARALVTQPRILVLDEATRALDSVTERRIYENLGQLDCTAIVIAHRLSTVADADLILVMEEGRIVESGTHPELMARHAAYYDLISNQAVALAA